MTSGVRRLRANTAGRNSAAACRQDQPASENVALQSLISFYLANWPTGKSIAGRVWQLTYSSNDHICELHSYASGVEAALVAVLERSPFGRSLLCRLLSWVPPFRSGFFGRRLFWSRFALAGFRPAFLDQLNGAFHGQIRQVYSLGMVALTLLQLPYGPYLPRMMFTSAD